MSSCKHKQKQLSLLRMLKTLGLGHHKSQEFGSGLVQIVTCCHAELQAQER